MCCLDWFSTHSHIVTFIIPATHPSDQAKGRCQRDASWVVAGTGLKVPAESAELHLEAGSNGCGVSMLRMNDCVSAQVRKYTGHRDKVNALWLSKDDKLVASAGADKTVHIWELATGMCSMPGTFLSRDSSNFGTGFVFFAVLEHR